jgi:hypothetical protein
MYLLGFVLLVAWRIARVPVESPGRVRNSSSSDVLGRLKRYAGCSCFSRLVLNEADAG